MTHRGPAFTEPDHVLTAPCGPGLSNSEPFRKGNSSLSFTSLVCSSAQRMCSLGNQFSDVRKSSQASYDIPSQVSVSAHWDIFPLPNVWKVPHIRKLDSNIFAVLLLFASRQNGPFHRCAVLAVRQRIQCESTL